MSQPNLVYLTLLLFGSIVLFEQGLWHVLAWITMLTVFCGIARRDEIRRLFQ